MTSPPNRADTIRSAPARRASASWSDAEAPPRFLIAGGGIGGLATALALARYGMASVVLERRPEYGDDGAGIQIGPNGTRILEALGAAPFLRSRITQPEAIRIRDASNARELAVFPLGAWIGARHGAPYWVAHRRDLHTALFTSASCEPHIVTRNGVDVTVVREEDRGITAVSANGESFRGDGLIAADGAWSALREAAFEGGMPLYTGKCAIRTVIPITDVPDALRAMEVGLWLGPDVHVVHYPVSAGDELALVAVFDDRTIDVDWNAPASPDWVAARTKSFAPALRELLARPASWRRWSLMTLTRPPRLAVGRMAMVGDAAHPILPFLAQGGVMALEDALVVARELAADPGHVASAFRAYDAARIARVRRVARASRSNGRIYHLRGPLAAARNLALGRIPPERFMRRYDWLYGWTVPADEP